jgi:hypothetical protein
MEPVGLLPSIERLEVSNAQAETNAMSITVQVSKSSKRLQILWVSPLIIVPKEIAERLHFEDFFLLQVKHSLMFAF